jgi:predicted NAD-dependent protein-ADP-ribosyltransferase YbiA (DUF1768 family)
MADNFFTFFHKKRCGRELSNFHECDIIINRNIYSSGELAFHGIKYNLISKHIKNINRKKELINYSVKFQQNEEFDKLSGHKVKSKGGKNGLKLSLEELEIWYKYRNKIQKKICQYKYETYDDIKKILDNTNDKVLVHPALRCSDKNVVKQHWTGRIKIIDDQVKIIGHNKLGKIWMDIRRKNNK